MLKWIQANPGIAAATIAAIAAIVGGLVAAGTKFLLDFLLAERFKRRWQTIEIKRKYSSPIIRATDDLAARIETLSIEGKKAALWLKEIDPHDVPQIPFERYFYVSTIFLLARLVGWIEILKKEQTYLEFSSIKETREFNAYVNLIYAVLSSPAFTSGNREPAKEDHWIFFHYLSGIGEAVIRRDETGSLTCITFPDFCKKLKEGPESEFGKWARQVERLFVNIKIDKGEFRWHRIQILWFCLDRFLEFVDPKMLRTTRNRERSKGIDKELKAMAKSRAEKLGLKWIS